MYEDLSRTAQRFHCVIIAPESEALASLRKVISSSAGFELVEWFREYPDEAAFLRMLRLDLPSLLVVHFTDQVRALHLMALAQQYSPGTEILAFCEENISILSTLLRAGVRDYVTTTSSFENIASTFTALAEKLKNRPVSPNASGQIITFLPAKPGCGASTIAANATFAASKLSSKRVLLADFDRNSGVQAFLFKLRAEHTLGDALQSVQEMDGDMWSRLRSQAGKLDILPSDLETCSPMDSTRASHLMQFFRRAYDLTSIDLSGQLDSTSIEAMLESKRVYIVCTQELACQHMLIRKVAQLRIAGLDRQMRLIVNRYMPRHVMSADRISELVRVPVKMTIANDYDAVNNSMQNGALIKPDSTLGKSYSKLAERMLEERSEVPKSKHRFLEFFSQTFMRSADSA